MRYLGGKSILSKKICPIINAYVGDRLYVEPFCGALNVASRIESNRMFLNDLFPLLTSLHEKVLQGQLELPDTVSFEDYARYKEEWLSGVRTELHVLVGFSCSFGGKFFDGYARAKPEPRVNGKPYTRDFFKLGVKKLLKDLEPLRGKKIEWSCKDYRDLSFEQPCLIYCDPPYKNTEPYSGLGVFDHDMFWEWCRDRSKDGHIVIVSEQEAQCDAKIIYESEYVRGFKKSGKNKKVVERLFLLKEVL